MECRVSTDEYLQETDDLGQAGIQCPVSYMAEYISIMIKHACGKTVYCRDGLIQIKQIIVDIANGKGRIEDLATLSDICNALKSAGGCLLTETAAEKVLESLGTFSNEWEKHCGQKQCSAMLCKGCYSLYIDPSVCSGCGECRKKVSEGAILGADGMIHIIKNDMEIKEKAFEDVCPYGAIKKAGLVKPQIPQELIPAGSFKPAAGLLKRRRRNTGN